MSGVDYKVSVLYDVQTSGAESKVKGLSSAFDSLGKMAGSAGSIMDSMASTMFSVGAGLATLGAAGAIGAIKKGLNDINGGLESARIGFASTFEMLGAATNFDQGLGMAKGLIEDIRADAKALPGEFSDFVQIGKSLAPAMVGAGKSMQELRDMTRQTAIAGANFLDSDFKTAGREMAMLIHGRASSHNTLGTNMGITATTQVNGKDFNKATDDERIKFLNERLSKGDNALKAYERSWAGLTSTMTDGIKALLGRATLPLFDRIKQSISGINDILASGKAEKLADVIGRDLVIAYDYLAEKGQYIAGHWAGIRDSAVKFGSEIRDAFEKIWPIVERIGSYLGEKLKDPGEFLKHAAELRIGLGVAEHAPGIMKGASSLLGGEGLGGLAGGGAAGAVAAAGAAAVALVALAGAVDVVTSAETRYVDISGATIDEQMRQGMDFWDFIAAYGKGMWLEIKENWSSAWAETSDALSMLWSAVHPLVDVMGVALLGAIDAVIYAFRLLLAPITALKYAIEKIAGPQIEGGGIDIAGAIKRAGAKDKELKAVGWNPSDAELAMMTKTASHVAGKLGGKGATNVTVNAPLTVLSDADPDRLAMKVATHVAGKMRNATTSLGSPTFRHF